MACTVGGRYVACVVGFGVVGVLRSECGECRHCRQYFLCRCRTQQFVGVVGVEHGVAREVVDAHTCEVVVGVGFLYYTVNPVAEIVAPAYAVGGGGWFGLAVDG